MFQFLNYEMEIIEKMKNNNIDAYIVPTNDFHGSEYVGDYFKSRSFISGFTGSAGTVVITQDEAGLWTDGRYFLQAEKELMGSSINLYKISNSIFLIAPVNYEITNEMAREEMKSKLSVSWLKNNGIN